MAKQYEYHSRVSQFYRGFSNLGIEPRSGISHKSQLRVPVERGSTPGERRGTCGSLESADFSF